MLSKVLLVSTGLLLSFGLNAQVRTDRGSPEPCMEHGSQLVIRYGVKFGSLNLSTISNNMEIDPNFGMGTGFRIRSPCLFTLGTTLSQFAAWDWVVRSSDRIMYSYQAVSTGDGNLSMFRYR